MAWYSNFYNTGTGGTTVKIIVCDQLTASINTTKLDGIIYNEVDSLLAIVNSTKLTAIITSC